MAQVKKRTAKAPSTEPPKTADVTGNGGELHQGVVAGERMTTDQGMPISDDQNSLKAGERGHKFIGWNAASAPLFEAAGVEEDAGVIELTGTAASAKAFLKACAALRMWERDVQP